MRKPGVPALLAAIAVLLLGVLAAEWRMGPARAPAAAVARRIAAAPPPSPVPPAAQAQSWSATILARPLFYPSRRPPAATAVAATESAGLPRLSAVLVSDAGSTAIFAGPGADKPVIAHVGDTLGAYRVSTISAGQVTLAGPNGQSTLRPSFDPGHQLVQPAPVAQGNGSILEKFQNGHAAAVAMPPPPTLQGLIALQRSTAAERAGAPTAPPRPASP